MKSERSREVMEMMVSRVCDVVGPLRKRRGVRGVRSAPGGSDQETSARSAAQREINSRLRYHGLDLLSNNATHAEDACLACKCLNTRAGQMSVYADLWTCSCVWDGFTIFYYQAAQHFSIFHCRN